MPSTGRDRIEASLKALGTTWLIAGVVFCVLVKGPGTVIGCVIWGSGMFLVGWLVIALPLIAIGGRVMRLPALPLAFAGGFAGTTLMLSSNLLVRIIQRDVHWAPFSFRELAWPGIAFTVGFVGIALYRMFLCGSIPDVDRSSQNKHGLCSIYGVTAEVDFGAGTAAALVR